MLVAIVLGGALVAVYSTIRYSSSQSQQPQTLIATDETNSAFQKALSFTVGYYGSILKVTGNQSYAYANATIYMQSALRYIASMNPSWGASIKMTSLRLNTDWFSNPSISTGSLSVVYDLQALGIYGVNYTTSCSLGLQIFNSPNKNQVCLNVTQDLSEPAVSLARDNFAFYSYDYSMSNWKLVNSISDPITFANGTYLINVPFGIDTSAFMVQVTDSRGIIVHASSYNSINLNFAIGSLTYPGVVELLQNGTMRWFGQDLLNMTNTQPLPPVALKSLHLCQTGSTLDLPFQVEDWASEYQIPLGMTNSYTIISNNQMIVFQISPSIYQLTLWWNGSDTAIQPSAGYTCKYFTADNPDSDSLSNGNINLQFITPVQIKTSTGSVSSTATFMRINGQASTDGSGKASYVIQKGVVRDVVQVEGEWSDGAPNSPNVYSQMVFTLPANSNFYTYQLRLILINSAATRNMNDISAIQLKTTISSPQAMTENGIVNGIPIVTNGTGTFNNSTGSAHHWSQLVNTGMQGTGIMFTDGANQQLYAFDSIAGKYTGALYVNTAVPVIELNPVTSAGPVSFNTPLDVTWSGAVATFNGVNPLYATSEVSSSWLMVEQPPSVNIKPASSSSAWIEVSPSANPVGTPVTITGAGFVSNSPVTIAFNENTVATVTSTTYGMIPSGTTFAIPDSPPGIYTISAMDASSNYASANYTVTLHPMELVTFQSSGVGSDAGSAAILTIDSVQYPYSSLPISFNWEAETTHTIIADSSITAGAGKQYVWLSWSDGGSQTHDYTVPASSATIISNYKTQYQVSFTQAGIDSSAGANTILTVGSTNYAYNALPTNVWVDSGAAFSWVSTVSGGAGKQFVLTGSSGSSPISATGSFSATYKTQYQVSFTQAGIDSSAGANTILTVGSTNYAYNALPTWVDSGAAFSWVSTVSGGAGKQFVLTGSSGSSPITLGGTYSATYKTQYQFTVSSAVGTPSGQSTGYYDVGTSITSSISAAINVNGPPMINYTSTGYTGTGSAGSGSGQSVAFTLNSASMVTWNWHGLMTLYPDGTGNDGIPNVSGASAHWQAVSDSSTADNTAYVYVSSHSAGNYIDYYATQNHGTATGAINSVTEYIRAERYSGTNTCYGYNYLRLGSSTSIGAQWTLPTSYGTHSSALARPGGGTWSWTDIDNLQSGVQLYRASGTEVRCTLIWVIVDFNA